jgi:tetratricopeptide (TPR) repeat protein
MNRRFLLPVLLIASFYFSSVASAQTAPEFYSKAKTLMNYGKLDSAAIYLNKALELSPDDLSMLEDQVYLEYLRRDFAKAITVGKKIAARPDAGTKTFQLVGMAFKEIADYKEAKKIYELALEKFPNSGLLYAEYGDMFIAMNKKADAIRIFEKGIEMDPGHSSNYYFATIHYAENRNPLWAILYGENFINIESLSDRTKEIKSIITDLYKKISTPGYLTPKNNSFAQAVAVTFSKQPPVSLSMLNVEALTSLRTAFIKDWNQENSSRFPFRLFEYHDQLIKAGMFDAYNQWLFGTSLNATVYSAWMDANKEKMATFQQFIGGRVYKIPAGQYYQTK